MATLLCSYFKEINMHSHDRTLLAKLGFADDDKDCDHDSACSYLRENPYLIIDLFKPDLSYTYTDKYCNSHFEPKDYTNSAVCEVPISKGSGQYKTTIGFIDVKITYRANGILAKITQDQKITEYKDSNQKEWFVEVKSKEISAATILRQINLYNEYLPRHKNEWIVAILFTPSKEFVDELNANEIKVVKLGEKFRVWQNAVKAPYDILEI